VDMVAVVYAVELLPKGKLHYYAENGEDIKPNDLVLVMSEFGLTWVGSCSAQRN